MAELTQAYKLLMAYAENVQRGRGAEEPGSGGAGEQRSQGAEGQGSKGAEESSSQHPSTPAPQHPCTFSRQAVERTLLIAIRRQEML